MNNKCLQRAVLSSDCASRLHDLSYSPQHPCRMGLLFFLLFADEESETKSERSLLWNQHSLRAFRLQDALE